MFEIAPGLDLPLDAVTQRISIFGKTRTGKSHTGQVFTEEVVLRKHPVTVIDPKGDWYGLRSSADGRGPGLPITILGGAHGDLPLEAGAGKIVADMVVQERASFILDLSHFESREDEVRFLTDFADRLYRKNRKSMLLVLDEADSIIPEDPENKAEIVMARRYEQIARRGMGRGIGLVLISQRPASIGKGALSQTELMIAHQTRSPHDQEALAKWYRNSASKEQQAEFMKLLDSLKRGTAIVCSPSWLEIWKVVEIREKKTYDSGATPRVGHARRAPKILAPVDLERLKRHMAETVERAKNEDPELLRGRIRELEMELRKLKLRPPPPAPKPAPAPGRVKLPVHAPPAPPRIVKVPVLGDSEYARYSKALEKLLGLAKEFGKKEVWLSHEHDRLLRALRAAKNPVLPNKIVLSPQVLRPPLEPRPAPPKAKPEKEPKEAIAPSPNGISKRMRQILRAMAMFRRIGLVEVSRKWVAPLARVSCRSSGYNNNLSLLSGSGHIRYPKDGHLELTPEGELEAGEVPDLSVDEFFQSCQAVVSQKVAKLLEVLREAYPEKLTRPELAERACVSAQSSGFNNNVSTLKTAGMADYPEKGSVKLASWVILDHAEAVFG